MNWQHNRSIMATNADQRLSYRAMPLTCRLYRELMAEWQSHALGNRTQSKPQAYLFMIHDGPTYSAGEPSPLCKLLSRRFADKCRSYDAHEVNITSARFQLRVVKTAVR